VLTEDVQHAREVQALSARPRPVRRSRSAHGPQRDPDRGSRAHRGRRRRVRRRARRSARLRGQVRDRTPEERKRSCAPLFDALVAIAREHGLEELETITSGTPTFVEALEHEGLASIDHSISPGIVVYWDRNSEALGIEGFSFAASVLSRVISAPHEDRITLDAGLEGDRRGRRRSVRRARGLAQPRGAEAERGTSAIQVRYGSAPRVGELVELVPKHVCPMINLADQVALLEGDALVSIAPVAAHAHEIAPPSVKG
jgi:D-serine deaminase-like pyridoxal phosphate-dependent protein